MPATKRKIRQCTLYSGSPSNLPITDLIARFSYKLRDKKRKIKILLYKKHLIL